MLDSLKIGDMHATALLALASEFEVFEGDIPETPKDRLSEAHDLVSFAIDSKAEIDDEEVEEQIDTMLALAGVKIDGDNGDIISYGDPPEQDEVEEMLSENSVEIELPEDDAEGDESGDGNGDDEAAFDVDDIIGDWSSMKIKEAKEALAEAAELEGDEELEFEEVQNLLQWENEQDKPRSSVVKALEALLEEYEDGSGDDDTEGDAGEDKNGDEEPEDEGGAEAAEYDEEPYDAYDESKVGDIKEVINDEDRTVEELEYILGYEREHKDRSTITKACETRMEELSEPAEEEKPKGRRRRGSKDDPDESGEVDDAVAEDDERDKRSSRRGKTAKGDFEKDLAPHFKDLISEEHATEQAEKLGLKPQDDEYEEDELPPLPDDIAKTDHDELSNLMLVYQAAHSSASWYAAKDYALSVGYEEVADYYEDTVLEDAEGPNKEARDAMAKTDDRVVYFRAKQKKHYQNYVIARDARNDIKRRVETVSRVGGFKVDDDDTSDLGSGAKKTRTRTRKRS